MREPTRKGEAEEESRAQTSRTVGIASVSGELMREITSRGERGCLLAGGRGDRNLRRRPGNSNRKVTERGHRASI